jgi:hypothetical protein
LRGAVGRDGTRCTGTGPAGLGAIAPRLRAAPGLTDPGHFLLELLLLLQKPAVLLQQLAHLRLHFLQLVRQRIDLPLLG